jgi:hypothetical protein
MKVLENMYYWDLNDMKSLIKWIGKFMETIDTAS